jgi:hypothetical protein
MHIKKEVFMKKILFLLLNLVLFNLEATHFQSSMNVTPLINENAYLVEMQIKKMVDGQDCPELVATPKIICALDQPAQLTIESEDKVDFISIQVMISDISSQKAMQASVLMKEKGHIVLSFDHVIQLNGFEFHQEKI